MGKVESWPECFLGSVVNPGEYWLVSKLKPHVKDVKILEEMLSEEMNQILTVPDSELLVPKCCVAVENTSAKGNWQRGKVVEKLGKEIYKVFLVDCGCFTNVEARHVQLIKDRKYVEVEPLAFRLHLYGIVPFIGTDESKKKVCKSWSPAANKFVNNIFSQRHLIYVKKLHIVNRVVFGDLYLIDKPDAQPFSLGKLLCINEYAVYAELYFKRKVMEVDSSVSSCTVSEKDLEVPACDLTMKLDRVKQWQLSTAQCQMRYHQEGCSGLKSPSSRISDSENTVDCSFYSEYIEAEVNVSITLKDSMKEEVIKEPPVGTSEVECSAIAQPLMLISKLKNSNSVETERVDISLPSTEGKKEFKLVLEENLKESPFVGYGSSFGIFTFFCDSIVQPVDKFRNLNISQSIILNLEKEGNFNYLSQIQRWGIPSIQRGHNVVMIGGAKTGKTLSYVIPLLALLQERMEADEMSIGNGPVAIILCSGSRSCERLYYICHLLLRNNLEKRKPKFSVRVEVVYGSSREKKSWVQLTNGCELLISTPHCLTRLLNHRRITNLERLDYLVLDEVDVIIQEPFLSPIKIILHQSKLSKDCQRIFCGEKWTPELGNLVYKFAKNHAILIGSYLEAAIYARLKPDVLLVDSERKPQILLDATLEKIGKYKILIVCEYTSEVMHLCNEFKSKGHGPLFAHSEMVVHDIKAVEQRWKSATVAPIMICCDDVMHQLAIEDAEMMIHYNLPSKSKTNFGNRFSALMKSYQQKSLQVENAKELSVLILVDDHNHYQLPHIVDFVVRLGGKIPERIRELSQEILWQIEVNKKEIPICYNLLEFGECKNVRDCPRRHAFINEIDSGSVALSGLVKFEVLHVHSVCHLSVRLIEIFDKSGKKSALENFTVEISDKLREFFEIEENRSFIGAVELNKLCAVQLEDSNGKRFERGRIIELKKFNKLNKVVEVLVKLVDTGQLSRISVYKLYELPEGLKNYVPQALDVFLCNLLPNDFDRSWSEETVFLARSLFTKPLKENQFWIGRIRLALQNSLHLEPVKLCRFLEKLNTHVIDFCSGRKLLAQGIAVQNEKHLEKLRSLCEKANIEMPACEAEEDRLNKEIVEPQWAFLDGDLPMVEFISAESTSCLYLRMVKFRDLLTKLEKDCQKQGDELIMSNNKNKWTPDVGMYCLALHENRWNRGRIQSVENEKVFVFFIDYGDTHYIVDLVPIPTVLLTQLPAQAIECCLVGVKHDSACTDRVLDEIYSFSNEGVDDLYVSVTGKSEYSRMTGGWKYQVNLLNPGGISLSRKLVEAGFVKPEMENFHLAENVDIVPSCGEGETDDTTDEEVEDVKESYSKDEVLKLEANDSSYKLNISDDMIDDENAQLMLEEFMAHVFPRSVTERKEASDQKVEVSNGESATVTAKKSAIGTSIKKCKLTECYTPQLLWCQDRSEIQMKIMLNNVERYNLNCSSTHFLLSCLLDGKLYVTGLRLFGSVNPQLSQVRIKPFYVQVVLKKICPLQWPRLTMDKQKHRWIKFDVEDFSGGQCSYVEEICKKALAEIESGEIKRPEVEGEIKLVPSTDSEDDSESESDMEDANFI